MAYGFRPNPKYSTDFPFYPFGQGALIASMQSYEEQPLASQLNASAQNHKLMAFVAAPSKSTVDIASALTNLDSNNPQQGAWLAPVSQQKTIQNAGNLPNPSGLDNTMLGKFA